MGLRVRITRRRPTLYIRAAPGTALALAGTAVVLLGLLFAFPPGAEAQVSVGPLRTSEQNPLYRFLYVPEMEPAAPVREGALRFELSSSYSNILEASNRASHAHLFDLEQMTNSLTVRYGWKDALEVGARMGLYTGWGGFLDPFISGFHNFFRLPNGGRGSRPDGAYVMLLEHDELEGGRFEFAPDERILSLEDFRVFAKWRLRGGSGDGSLLSLRAGLRRAAGPVAAGRIDGAVSVHGRLARGVVVLHGSGGLALADPPPKLEPLVVPQAVFASGTLEYRRWSTVSAMVQVRGSTSYVRGFTGGELKGFPLNIAFGLGGTRAGGWGWQLSFSEDLIPSGPAIDFTVDAEVSREIGP